jgi:hypothetical protein
MSKYLFDQELRARLNGLNEQIEFCDEHGETLGRFVPEAEYRQMFYAALARECPYSAEELERMHRQEGGQTLEEFWKGLSAKELGAA